MIYEHKAQREHAAYRMFMGGLDLDVGESGRTAVARMQED